MRLRLTSIDPDQDVRLEVPVGRHVLGSGPLADLRLQHASVSRQHAAIISHTDSTRLLVEDLGSRNGTFFEGQRIQRVDLAPGMQIRLGAISMELQTVDADEVALGRPLDAAAGDLSEQPFAQTSERLAEVDLGPAEPTVDQSLGSWIALEIVPQAIALLRQEGSATRLAQLVGGALMRSSDVFAVEIRTGRATEQSVLFSGSTETGSPAQGETGIALRVHGQIDENRSVEIELRALEQSATATQQLQAVADLLAFSQHDSRPSESPATSPGHASVQAEATDTLVDGLPEPSTVVSSVRNLYWQARQVAPSQLSALILGESGTGKELLARFIHKHRGVSDIPFVAINCAALPKDLLEAELFGIESGVATGVSARPGKFELAHRGTLFLDEIGEMPLETQALLLRVVQERQVQRIGSASLRPAEVKIVCATNQELDQIRDTGRFREDLFYRLAGCVLRVPPLRSRQGDVVNLAVHFASREAATLNKPIRGLAKSALTTLMAYDWPGNVRQLELEMTRAVALAPNGALIDRSLLSPEVLAGPIGLARTLADRLDAHERREIQLAIDRCDGDMTRTAQELGISRATLYRKLGKQASASS